MTFAFHGEQMSRLVYGICVGGRSIYHDVTEPAIRAVDPDAKILTVNAPRSIFAGYNVILERARQRYNGAGVVLMHDDLELRDPNTAQRLRAALTEPDVAVVGLIGGRGVRDMPWWKADSFVGRACDPFAERVMATAEGDVDALDGILLALSPWAVEHLRFDERRYRGFHGYDADVCAQARAAGRRVVAVSLDTFHHARSIVGSESHGWHHALYTWRLKWAGGCWRDRVVWRVKRSAHLALASYRKSVR